jgi:hypothetical protein
MNLAQAGEILKAVRNHPQIGLATCSYIDETMTDLEVLEEVKEAGITTAEQAIAHLVIVEKILRAHEEEMTANWRES